MQSVSLFNHTVTAAEDLTACRFVTHTGAVPGAGANTLGIALSDTETGDDCPVAVIGSAVIEASEAIALGAAVETTADGRAAVLDTGKPVARLLQAATGAGSKVEALLLPN